MNRIARAVELAQRLMIVDTHIDVPYRLVERMEDVGERTDHGDFDHPRAKAGGLDVVFMSIYIPARHQEQGGAKALADRLIDMMERLAIDHPDKFGIVTGVDEARREFGAGRIALALGMENGAGIEGDLANLTHFYDRGVRYVTLVHSKDNRICDSSYDDALTWGGLSPFGEQVVEAMNRLGMMIDVSHVSDAAFDQVLARTRAPVIASHSSCRRFTPGWERNISDEMIEALAANGGAIQINFGSSFLDDDYRLARQGDRQAIKQHLEANGIDEESDRARDYREQFFREHPLQHASVAAVADHIDHVVGLVGVDHVGLGSDFDGVGDSLPDGLRDVSEYPNLLAELLERDYDEPQIAKICSGNLLRVWSEVERVATRMEPR